MFTLSLCEHLTLSSRDSTDTCGILLESVCLSAMTSLSQTAQTFINKVKGFCHHRSIMLSLPSGAGNLEVNFIREQHNNDIGNSGAFKSPV